MKKRFETKKFITFVYFFFAVLILLSSCSKRSSIDKSFGDIPSADKPAFYTLVKEIQQALKELEYPDELSHKLVKIINVSKCVLWKQKLDTARQDYKDKNLSAAQVAHIEEEVVQELYRTIRKDISSDNSSDLFDLPSIIKDKKASCFGYSQLFYILGNSLELKVEVLDVLALANNSLPVNSRHMACLVTLTGNNVIMVDLTNGFVSMPFGLEEEFDKVGNYWELKNQNNRLGIHRRIQIWDRNGVVATIYYCKALVCYISGRFPEALSFLTKAIELNPKCAFSYIMRGNSYSQIGRYTEAISDYSKSIEIDPINVDAYYSRGFVYNKLKRYLQAISDFSKAIDLNPKYANAYCNRGNLYCKLNQYSEAISDYDKAIELDPKFAGAYYNRGLAHHESGRYTEAISDYSKAIEFDSKIASAYYGRGLVYHQLKNYTNAISDYDKTIKLNPNNIDAYFRRGRAYGDLNQYMEAIFDFTKVIELNPNKVDAYYGRGLAKAYLHKTEEAKKDLQKAVELDPALKEDINAISDHFNLGL